MMFEITAQRCPVKDTDKHFCTEITVLCGEQVILQFYVFRPENVLRTGVIEHLALAEIGNMVGSVRQLPNREN